MESRARVLGYAVVAMLLVGGLIAATPFVASLKPSAKADSLAGKFHVDISNFEPNSYQLIEVEQSKLEVTNQFTKLAIGRAWLVIRKHSGEFVVFWLPTWDDSIPMPRHVWGQHEGYCYDLGPPTGKTPIDESTLIQCIRSDSRTDYFSEYWYWNIDGENLSGKIPDLIRMRAIALGDTLAISNNWVG